MSWWPWCRFDTNLGEIPMTLFKSFKNIYFVNYSMTPLTGKGKHVEETLNSKY